MPRPGAPKRRGVFCFPWGAKGFFLPPMLFFQATKGADNIAAVWPPSGYFLALLLLMPASARVAAFVGMAAASLAANIHGGAPLWSCFAFTLSNLCEAVVALWLIRRSEPGALSFMVPRSVIRFCVAAFAASTISAAMAWALTGKGLDFLLSWRS